MREHKSDIRPHAMFGEVHAHADDYAFYKANAKLTLVYNLDSVVEAIGQTLSRSMPEYGLLMDE